ncbi:hypothetical protein [Fodinicola feengrottensis]|uniref:hypothetical protein n=1 Tax=Fodinicola feengrottensis TaxID=435914 RepID=UPI0024419213|nr:hypothetical protein [Fodinicola feengrottensis]
MLEDRAAKSLTVRAERTPDPVAAAKRAEQREARVSAGLDELDQWLSDQVRTGLAGLSRGGYAQLDAMAARMVDAQAPAVAGTLRRLSTVGGPGGRTRCSPNTGCSGCWYERIAASASCRRRWPRP